MSILTPFVLFAVVIVLISMFALFPGKSSPLQKSLAPIIIFVSSLLTLTYLFLIFKHVDRDYTAVLMNWQLPFAKMQLGIDPLSAFFLIPLLILTAASSIYGWKYFGNHKQERSHWLFFSLLVAGMVFVLLSRNAVAFIFSWEIMSVSSFFLVITDKTSTNTMRAGLIYFITAHFGAALLFIVFFILSSSSGSFDFAAWNNLDLSSQKASIIFITALIAFGSKAGFIPFHVWLPLAHPSAPSHVSALMSGIMIKMGIYGIFRILTFIAPYQTWWGILIICIGSISGVLGVLFAIGQHDIKKLLAYHSVENIGIIMLGLGIGITGASLGYPEIAFFGFAGALLHVVNHAMFKGLLFLGAGAIIRQTKTGELDHLGGLIRKMPATALLFTMGSIAIAGLPFFNGFISELLIYISAISGTTKLSCFGGAFAALFTGASLALIGGLAVACFTKVIGTVFLGEPRVELKETPGEVPFSMLSAMILLAGVCSIIGTGSYFVLPPFLIKPVAAMTGSLNIGDSIILMKHTAKIVTAVLFFVLLLGSGVLLLYKLLTKNGKTVTDIETWGCGYNCPKPSMQYTSSSFAAPIIDYFSISLDSQKSVKKDCEMFPVNQWEFHFFVNDWILTRIYEPVVVLAGKSFSSLGWLQNGKTGLYVFYIALTLLSLIIWKFLL